MTAQIPDVLIYRGRTLDLCGVPLAPWLSRLPKRLRPTFEAPSTACWRGYVATWEIIGRRLHLVDLRGRMIGADGAARPASLSACFPHRRAPIPATWFSGDVRCPEGRLRAYVHAAFASTYERDRMFYFKRGELLEECVIHTPPAPLLYRIEEDGRRTFLEGTWPFPRHEAPDPFPADAPVEPWRLWGDSDWGLEPESHDDDDGWRIDGCTSFPPSDGA